MHYPKLVNEQMHAHTHREAPAEPELDALSEQKALQAEKEKQPPPFEAVLGPDCLPPPALSLLEVPSLAAESMGEVALCVSLLAAHARTYIRGCDPPASVCVPDKVPFPAARMLSH